MFLKRKVKYYFFLGCQLAYGGRLTLGKLQYSFVFELQLFTPLIFSQEGTLRRYNLVTYFGKAKISFGIFMDWKNKSGR